MRRVKVPGLDIQIPPGSAFKIETPPMMPKMHLLAAVVAPRGYGKGVITTNLIEQLKVVDRLILVSPSAASNKALNDRLNRPTASSVHIHAHTVCVDVKLYGSVNFLPVEY